MLSFKTNGPCLDCDSVKDALKLVDKKIDMIARIHYAQITHLSSRKFDLQKLRDLLQYKEMLLHLQFNTAYYSYNVLDIISKVKTLAT